MADILGRLDPDARDAARESDMPEQIDAMLAKLVHEAFSDDAWIFERKLDGERVLAYVDADGSVRLTSRNDESLDDTYPELQEALTRHAVAGCILDGEVVAFDADGVSDFQALQPRMQASSREEAEASDVEVTYYLFDCLYVQGHDVTEVPLRSRKKLLGEAVEWSDPLRLTQHRNADGEAYFEEACERGWEGLIAKRADSTYVHSRSSKWRKIKCTLRQEFVVGGFTEPEGERVGFGALLLGFYRDGDLVYAGEVGTGFDDDTLEDLRSDLERIERKTSPYDEGDPETDGVHFVTPEKVCEVAFTEWTEDDRLRHPRFMGLRRDKDPEDVHKEDESQALSV